MEKAQVTVDSVTGHTDSKKEKQYRAIFAERFYGLSAYENDVERLAQAVRWRSAELEEFTKYIRDVIEARDDQELNDKMHELKNAMTEFGYIEKVTKFRDLAINLDECADKVMMMSSGMWHDIKATDIPE